MLVRVTFLGAVGAVLMWSMTAALGASLAGHASTSRFAASVQDPQTTVWSGIYTAAQAERGHALYQEQCSYCHMDSLAGFGGDTEAAALTGARFFVRWR